MIADVGTTVKADVIYISVVTTGSARTSAIVGLTNNFNRAVTRTGENTGFVGTCHN